MGAATGASPFCSTGVCPPRLFLVGLAANELCIQLISADGSTGAGNSSANQLEASHRCSTGEAGRQLLYTEEVLGSRQSGGGCDQTEDETST